MATKTDRNKTTPATPAKQLPRLSAAARRAHERLLLTLTSLPTAAGKEDRVVRAIETWVKSRSGLQWTRDRHGNLHIRQTRHQTRRTTKRVAPLLFQAHLDHPAFVIRAITSPKEIELEFRGGVHDPYFERAAIEVIDHQDRAVRATITHLDASAKPFKVVTARLAKPHPTLAVGDIARWALPAARITKGEIHTHGCDDLAAVAAALCAFDRLRTRPGHEHVGLLFTRSEEIGFIGTLGAARDRTIPRNARIVCLENSRSFPESPIGGGPILRVGDRRSVFVPELTNRINDVLTEYQKIDSTFRYQRKLMPGGTCEATAYACYGYTSTCLCLPLGNYHNMQNIDGVLAGKRPARIGPEFVSCDDFHGLVLMLEIIARDLDAASVPPLRSTMEKLWKDLKYVLKPTP